MNSSVLSFFMLLSIASVLGQISVYNVVEMNKYSNFSNAMMEKIKADTVAECSVQCRRRAWCCASVYSKSTGKCGLLISDIPTQSVPIGWNGVSSGGLAVVRHDDDIDQSSGCCSEMPPQSITYAAWGALNILTPENGPIASIYTSFTKAFDHTDVRVTFSSDLRCQTGCCRFYLTFNNKECADPAPTDLIMHQKEATSRNIFWTGYIEGICRGIRSGIITVQLHSGQCGTLAAGDMTIGIRTGIRLMAEEIQQSQTSLPSACPAQANFNIQQFALTGEIAQDSGVIYTVNYHKRLASTALKLTFLGTTQTAGSCGTALCGRWEFLINGASCANPQPIEGRVLQFTICGTDHHYTSPFSGICQGIPAGDLIIQVSLSSCPAYTGAPDMYTGYGTATRIIAEEVRMGTTFISPLATPVINVQNSVQNLASSVSSGLITSMSYVKTRNDSVLRVSWSSGLRQQITTAGVVFCNRWYIAFNGAGCTSPGPIDAIFFIDGSTVSVNYNSYRMQKFFGLCRNPMSAGTITVGLYVSTCSGYTYGSPYTWGTSTMTVEEVFE